MFSQAWPTKALVLISSSLKMEKAVSMCNGNEFIYSFRFARSQYLKALGVGIDFLNTTLANQFTEALCQFFIQDFPYTRLIFAHLY